MNEQSKKEYQAPTLKNFGEVSKITAGGAFSPPEITQSLQKDTAGSEEYKEGS